MTRLVIFGSTIVVLLFGCGETKTSDEKKADATASTDQPADQSTNDQTNADAPAELPPLGSWGTTSSSFERPPFIAIFATSDKSKRFAIIGAHLKPDKAIIEAEWLDEVSRRVESPKGVADQLLLGDLNLDCDYASGKELSSLKLKADRYTWLIDDTADTTTGTTNCAYDRALVTGQLKDGASAKIESQAIAQSDHFPIHATILGLNIGALNLKQFGESKAGDPSLVAETAVWICSKDVAFLMEIVTDDIGPIDVLSKKVAETCPGMSPKYSDPLGSTQYKERYLYYYKNSALELMDSSVVIETKPSSSDTTTKPDVSDDDPDFTPIEEPKQCCKICKTSKPCGDSCISKTSNCSKPVGCACNADGT